MYYDPISGTWKEEATKHDTGTGGNGEESPQTLDSQPDLSTGFDTFQPAPTEQPPATDTVFAPIVAPMYEGTIPVQVPTYQPNQPFTPQETPATPPSYPQQQGGNYPYSPYQSPPTLPGMPSDVAFGVQTTPQTPGQQGPYPGQALSLPVQPNAPPCPQVGIPPGQTGQITGERAEQIAFSSLTATMYEYQQLLKEIATSIADTLRATRQEMNSLSVAVTNYINSALTQTSATLSSCKDAITINIGSYFNANEATAQAISQALSQAGVVFNPAITLAQQQMQGQSQAERAIPTVPTERIGQGNVGQFQPIQPPPLPPGVQAAQLQQQQRGFTPEKIGTVQQQTPVASGSTASLSAQQEVKSPFAIDIPNSLAFKFGHVNDEWLNEAAKWGGEWLTNFLRSGSMDEFVKSSPRNRQPEKPQFE